MLNDASVEDNKGRLKPLFKMFKAFLKSFAPRFKRPVSLAPCAPRKVLFKQALASRMRVTAVLQIRDQLALTMDSGAQPRADG